ncbi:MAG: acyltransferase [Bacilli bacterium]
MGTIQNKVSRIFYLDIIKVLAIIGVVGIHVTAPFVVNLDILGSANWWFANSINGGARWAVPAFFMVSGALLLAPSRSTNEFKQLGKRLHRVVLPLIVWSVIYFAYKHYVLEKMEFELLAAAQLFLKEFVFNQVYVHFWFIYIMITVYVSLPIIQHSIHSLKKSVLEYYIIVWFAVTFIYRLIQVLHYHYTATYLGIELMNLPIFMDYIGYFVLGYYLHTYSFSSRHFNWLSGLGVLGFVGSIGGTFALTAKNDAFIDYLYTHFSPTTLFMSIAMFLWIKHLGTHTTFNHKLTRLVTSMSNATFGIYIAHLLIAQVALGGITDATNTSLFEIALMTFDTMLLFFISYIFVKFTQLNAVTKRLLLGE